MQLQPRNLDAVRALVAKGVTIPNPLTLDIGPEVDVDRISGDGVTIHPGCRIRGATTVISAGSTLGTEAPVTVEDCQLGRGVTLDGGFFSRSVFLDRARMGLGAHVREGTILEEEASGAHCVGLKQTILFPFVTLGSLINFCDCLMAGGTSRSDHSEVGSSYIHFNFTPDGNKTTASSFGDVPRGVMLDQPPIFLGGQGGAVGPVVTGYGDVVGAGSVLRDDIEADGLLVLPPGLPEIRRPNNRRSYKHLDRIIAKNVRYLAGLVALRAWYRHVRRPFFEAVELGPLVHQGALDALSSALRERLKRLGAHVATVSPDTPERAELTARIDDLLAVFTEPDAAGEPDADAEVLLAALEVRPDGYIAAIHGLPAEASAAGVRWLENIVDALCAQVGGIVPSLRLFDRP